MPAQKNGLDRSRLKTIEKLKERGFDTSTSVQVVIDVAEIVELLVKAPLVTLTVKYFFSTLPELSLTFTHTSFVPVPANLIDTELVEEKFCFVVHVDDDEAL